MASFTPSSFSTLASLLKPADVAEKLGVSPISVYRWASAGTLPSVKIGGAVRFVAEDIAAFIDSRRMASQAAE